MKLVRVQGFLKKCNIPYDYREESKCGVIQFEIDGKPYKISEYTRPSGSKVVGVLTNVGDLRQISNQGIMISVLKSTFSLEEVS